MADTTLSFNVLARDNASSTVTKIGQKFGALHLGVGKVAKGVAAVGPALAGLAVGAGIKQFIEDARESARVGRLTAQVVKSTGGAARITADQVGDLATAISNKTGADDEAIQSGQNLLLTFTNIKNGVGKGNDIFNQASQAITDMTAAMNGGEVTAEGMKTSSIQLGKALNNPIKGVTALQKVGVSFTESQKKQIKTLVDSGKTMEAQKIILGELSKEFGGAAEAASDPLTKLKTIAGNLSEQIGGYLLPGVDKFATFVGSTVIPRVSGLADAFAAKAGPKLKEFGGVLRSSVLPAITNFGTDLATSSARWAGKLIDGLKSGFSKGDWKPLGKALGDGVIKAFRGIGGKINDIGNSVGDLIDSVDWGRLGARVGNGLRGMLRSVDWKGIGKSLGDAVVNLFQQATELGEKIRSAFKTLMDRVDWQQVGRDSTDAIGRFISGVDWAKVAKTLGIAVLKGLKINKSIYETVTSSIGKLVQGMAEEAGRAIGRWFAGAGKWLYKAGGDLLDGLKNGVSAGVKGIGAWAKRTIVDPVVGAVKSFFGIKSPSTVFARIGLDLVAGLRGGVAAAVRGIGNFMSRTVVAPAVAVFGRAGSWLQQAGKNLVAGFKNGVSAIGRSIGSFITNNVITPLRSRFSPSGVWLHQAGKNVIAGFKNGISAIGATVGTFAYRTVISPLVAQFGRAGVWLRQAGKNVIAGFKNGMVSIWGDVTKWVGGIANWIKEHKGPVSLDGRLLIPAGKAIMSGFLKGLKSGAGPAWAFVKKVGGKTVAMLQSVNIGSNSLGGFGSGVERWRGVALQALAAAGAPANWIGSLLRRMNQESGGNPRAINLWDSNAKRGTPSIGLMQTIGPTFDAYAGPYRSRGIYDPFANIYAAIKYANARYGAAPRGWDRRGGYEKGTPWVPHDGPAFLHEGEAVVPRKVNEARLRGSEQTVVVEFRSDGSPHMDWLVNEVRKYVRVNGGNVQKVLGRG